MKFTVRFSRVWTANFIQGHACYSAHPFPLPSSMSLLLPHHLFFQLQSFFKYFSALRFVLLLIGCLCAGLSIWVWHPWRPAPGARVVANREFPNMDAWNRTWLLCKVRKCSYVESSLQSSDSFSLWLSDSSDIESESQGKRFSWKPGNLRTVWAHCCAHAHSPVLIVH